MGAEIPSSNTRRSTAVINSYCDQIKFVQSNSVEIGFKDSSSDKESRIAKLKTLMTNIVATAEHHLAFVSPKGPVCLNESNKYGGKPIGSLGSIYLMNLLTQVLKTADPSSHTKYIDNAIIAATQKMKTANEPEITRDYSAAALKAVRNILLALHAWGNGDLKPALPKGSAVFTLEEDLRKNALIQIQNTLPMTPALIRGRWWDQAKTPILSIYESVLEITGDGSENQQYKQRKQRWQLMKSTNEPIKVDIPSIQDLIDITTRVADCVALLTLTDQFKFDDQKNQMFVLMILSQMSQFLLEKKFFTPFAKFPMNIAMDLRIALQLFNLTPSTSTPKTANPAFLQLLNRPKKNRAPSAGSPHSHKCLCCDVTESSKKKLKNHVWTVHNHNPSCYVRQTGPMRENPNRVSVDSGIAPGEDEDGVEEEGSCFFHPDKLLSYNCVEEVKKRVEADNHYLTEVFHIIMPPQPPSHAVFNMVRGCRSMLEAYLALVSKKVTETVAKVEKFANGLKEPPLPRSDGFIDLNTVYGAPEGEASENPVRKLSAIIGGGNLEDDANQRGTVHEKRNKRLAARLELKLTSLEAVGHFLPFQMRGLEYKKDVPQKDAKWAGVQRNAPSSRITAYLKEYLTKQLKGRGVKMDEVSELDTDWGVEILEGYHNWTSNARMYFDLLQYSPAAQKAVLGVASLLRLITFDELQDRLKIASPPTDFVFNEKKDRHPNLIPSLLKSWIEVAYGTDFSPSTEDITKMVDYTIKHLDYDLAYLNKAMRNDCEVLLVLYGETEWKNRCPYRNNAPSAYEPLFDHITKVQDISIPPPPMRAVSVQEFHHYDPWKEIPEPGPQKTIPSRDETTPPAPAMPAPPTMSPSSAASTTTTAPPVSTPSRAIEVPKKKVWEDLQPDWESFYHIKRVPPLRWRIVLKRLWEHLDQRERESNVTPTEAAEHILYASNILRIHQLSFIRYDASYWLVAALNWQSSFIHIINILEQAIAFHPPLKSDKKSDPEFIWFAAPHHQQTIQPHHPFDLLGLKTCLVEDPKTHEVKPWLMDHTENLYRGLLPLTHWGRHLMTTLFYDARQVSE
eukprot:GHVN01022988.1.p1 GENE.GHVN01022988.1~~GHVN01022988.1.p1  ORF type:complete len:1074 (+),score=159.20 GHVN01022988.1:501-3722(+)